MPFLKDHGNVGTKPNNWQMGTQEMKKLLYNKGHHHLSEEAAHRMGQIFTSYLSYRWVISRLYKELQKTKHQVNNKIDGIQF